MQAHVTAMVEQRTATSTQDVGKEWRRRQRRDNTVVGGGLGVDSSVEAGTVRFEVAIIESKLSKEFDKGVRFASIDTGIDKSFRFASIDNNNFMSDSFGKGLNDKMSCL